MLNRPDIPGRFLFAPHFVNKAQGYLCKFVINNERFNNK